jgi:hypothetical protein
MKRRVKTGPAGFLIISMTLPSSSMFALSAGAGKLTRAMQPRVGQAIRKTLLEKLDDIRVRCFALQLPGEVTPKFVDQPPTVFGDRAIALQEIFLEA